MRLERVARTVVDGRDAQGREARDIRPTVLGARRAADGTKKLLSERGIESWARARREVGDLDLVSSENLPQVRDGIVRRAAGGEAVVDAHDGEIGDDVARDATRDPDRVETLAIDETVDLDLGGHVVAQDREHARGVVNGVVTDPGPRGVRPSAVQGNIDARGAVASALDCCTCGFTEDREVAREQVGARASEPTESVEFARDLLVVVPDPGEIDGRGIQLGSEDERDGHARLHIDGAATNEELSLDPHRKVGVNGHGIDVTGDNDAFVPPQRGASDQRVAIPNEFEVVEAGQRRLDCVAQRTLVARHGFDVAHLPRELDGTRSQIEHGQGGVGDGHRPSLSTLEYMTSRAAWGYGLATVTRDRTVLDTWYPTPHLGPVPEGTDPHIAPGEFEDLTGLDERRAVTLDFVTTEIDLDAAPASTPDAYLRLHLLSHLLVKPNTINLDGLFSHLPIVVWTNAGPVHPDDFDRLRRALQRAGIAPTGIDKFPRLLDYVSPARVRIADASRVRLGAHLAPGTTVMHEGFVNFNAGTLGTSMVEGRISQGVVVGDGADIGGGASIMGTLSGGGTERVSIGARALLGANSGVGIAIGDDTVVEAGLYVTAGTKVVIVDSGLAPRTVKAVELSGVPGLLFRRNSLTGAVEVLQRTGTGVELNSALHA